MRFIFFSTLGFILLCSCSRIPEPAGFRYSSQSKLQAAHHWDVLAADTAYQINNELLKDDQFSTPVYVKPTCGSDTTACNQNETTEFNEAFRDLLITQLVHFGIPTCAKPQAGAITINYKVQMVYHRTDRLRTFAPGLITGLTAAVEVLRNAPSQIVAVATAGAVDLANSAYVSSSHYEVIITTSMVSMRQYLFRSSSIYYINDADFWQYQTGAGKATKIEMTDSDLSQLPPPVNMAAKMPDQSPPPPKPGSADRLLPTPIRNL